MLAVYRAASLHPIEKDPLSPSPSGRGVGVRAGEPPAKVPPKPNPFAAKHRYSRNEPPESLVGSGNGFAFHHILDQNSHYAVPHPPQWQVSVHDSKNQEYSGQLDADDEIFYWQKDGPVTIFIVIAPHRSGFFSGCERF